MSTAQRLRALRRCLAFRILLMERGLYHNTFLAVLGHRIFWSTLPLRSKTYWSGQLLPIPLQDYACSSVHWGVWIFLDSTGCCGLNDQIHVINEGCVTAVCLLRMRFPAVFFLQGTVYMILLVISLWVTSEERSGSHLFMTCGVCRLYVCDSWFFYNTPTSHLSNSIWWHQKISLYTPRTLRFLVCQAAIENCSC